MTGQYGGLAALYNRLMAEGPFADWLTTLTRQHESLDALDVADIGCGTGTLTAALAKRCRRVVGVDVSEDMLTQAMQHEDAWRVTWLCQDMREFRLPHPVDLVVSSCDALNYLLSEADLARAFACCHQALKPHGWLKFDMLGPKRRDRLRDGVWHDVQEDCAAMYETHVDADGVVHFHVHAFVRAHGHLYERVEEHHRQRWYASETVLRLLDEAGFAVSACAGDFGRTPLADADRLVIHAVRR